jgi:adenine-specific DNA-methyltransferase
MTRAGRECYRNPTRDILPAIMKLKRPPLRIQPTTLWDYPSQDYGDTQQGRPGYKGATPSYIIWNLLQRYTEPKDLVVDPCAGSGTTLDVARDLHRRALGYDLAPARKDIFRVDARKLPLEDAKADFVFIDPPYSTHIEYSDDPRCIGKLDAAGPQYYQAMDQVISEIHRVLRPGKHMGMFVCDSFVKDKGFFPIGFELFGLLRKRFEPVDIVAVVRHNKTLEMGNYRAAAEAENFFLRGFNYLFIMRKAEPVTPSPSGRGNQLQPATQRREQPELPAAFGG